MLRETFIHIPGIGAETEHSLWTQGCSGWQHLLDSTDEFSCGSVVREDLLKHLRSSCKALDTGKHQYFKKALGLKDSWRAFPDFRHKCVYLDIETDGRSSGDSVTTVGLYDGETYTCLVKGDDLGNFPDVISQYSMIVTFFGAGFDLPMLQKRFPLVRFDQIHIDLCVTLKRLGIKGGLKKIEKQLGLQRGDDTEGLTGLDAIRLWRRYVQLRDEDALKTLIAYNREDVVNLEWLADYAYKNLWSQTRGALFGA